MRIGVSRSSVQVLAGLSWAADECWVLFLDLQLSQARQVGFAWPGRELSYSDNASDLRGDT